MSSLARWVLAHKRLVVLGWVLVTVAGIAAMGPASAALKNDPSVPHKEGFATDAAIAKRYVTSPGDSSPLLPVVVLPRGQTVRSPGVRADLGQIDARLRRALPRARIASYASTGNPAFASADGRTVFTLVYPRPAAGAQFGENPAAARTAARALRGAEVGGEPVHLTGFDALAAAGGGSSGPGLLLEALIGGVGALLVLAFVFGSVLAVVPIVMAVISIMTTFLPLLALTAVTSVSPIVQFLIVLIGLGVAIDYSLLIVSRWREERDARPQQRRRGRSARSRPRGGRSSSAGSRSRVGLLALIVLPVPFLRSIGLRRRADPARLDAGRDHAAARRAGQARPAPGLAASPHGRPARAAPGRAGRRRSRAGAGSPRSAGMAVLLALVFAATATAHGRRRRRHAGDLGRRQSRSRGAGARRDRRGRAAPARGPRRRRCDARSAWPPPCAAVAGIHGAVAPEGSRLAPRRHGPGRGRPGRRQQLRARARRRSTVCARPRTPPA